MRRTLQNYGNYNYLNLLIVITLNFITFSVGATNYYVSASGDDGNSGTSESMAWNSLAKVSSTTFKPGDQILFRKGDIFYGKLHLKGSGTSASPIKVGAYGSGAMPVITGLSKISNWELHGNGIYKTNIENISQLNLVLLNNKPVAMGRYPNSGYLTFESHSGTSTIVDNELSSQPNWTGAVAVVRTNHWILDRNKITNHNGRNITFQASSGYSPRDGFGYFIQSDLRTLDQRGEWFYSNGVLYMYFGSENPSSHTIEVGVIDQLVNMQLIKYIEFSNIEFKGSHEYGLYVDYADNVKIQGCRISAIGLDGIHARGAKFLEVRNNVISNCLSVGVKTKWDSNDSKFIENTITDIGMLPGMGGSADGTYMALSTKSKNALIQYNHIERVGYNGIDFHGDNTKVENNYVNKFCQYKDDGGGIYSFFETNTAFRFTGVKILNNIILNGGGHEEDYGVNPNSPNQVEGIYTDGLTNSFEIAGNTVAYTASAGIFLNQPRWHNIHSNTLYGNKKTQFHWNNLKMNGIAPGDNTVSNNIVFNLKADQHSMYLSDVHGEEILNFGTSNTNKYVTIQGDKPSFYTVTYNGSWNNDYYNLNEWITRFNRDVNSQEFETPDNEYVFEYNNSKLSRTVALRHAMVDLNGKKYSGSVTIAPYSSVVLLPDPDGNTDGGSRTIYTDEDIFICKGENYNGWNESGQYERVLLAAGGADSIVTTNLFVNPTYNLTENITITQGESYKGWNTSGVYESVYQSFTGCDSTVTTNLTVTQTGNTMPDKPDGQGITEYVTICEGETYMGYTEPGQYQRTESTSGSTTEKGVNLIASDNFSNGIGDWTKFGATGYAINISADEQEFFSAPSSMRIDCNENGDIIHYLQLITGGSLIVEQGKTYELSFNAKATTPFTVGNLIVVKGSSPWTDYGTFSDRKPDITTEWSTVKVTFTANYNASDATFRIYLGGSLPAGNSLYIDDFFFAEKSEQTDSQSNFITTYLTVLPTKYSLEDITILDGESYLGWTETGSYERTLTSSAGCDSIVTTNLTIISDVNTIEDISICEGESYLDWTSAGLYERVLTSASGGDSIVTTNLWINPVYSISEDITILKGESYLGWTETGLYERTLTSDAGCDSIVTTNLTIISDVNTVEDISICEGESYLNWTSAGLYERVLTSASGGDSIVTTNLWINPVYSISEDITISEGESYLGWTVTGVYQQVLTSVNGCDSVVTTNLFVSPKETNYFIPAWHGKNGQNHMTIGVVGARLNTLPLEADDEIAIFDGNTCVGASKLTAEILNDAPDSYLFIKVSECDGTGIGFNEGNSITYKIFDSSAQEVIEVNGISYQDDLEEWITSGNFVCNGTSVVEINTIIEDEPIIQTINLEKGWNIISSFVSPTDPDLGLIMENIREAQHLFKVQDELGNTYEFWGNKTGWRNEIGAFQNTEGYKVRVKHDCSLQISGLPVSLPMDIPLSAGANLVSFPVNGATDALNIVQPLIDQGVLDKIQDEQGNSIEYWGSSIGWINDIGDFKAGEGYVFNLNSDAVLSINEIYNKSTSIPADIPATVHFNVDFIGNGLNHMNINVTNLEETDLEIGDEIAAFDGDICVGAVLITERHVLNNAVSIIASLAENEEVNGFIEGHNVSIKTWKAHNNAETEFNPVENGEPVAYQSYVSSFIQLKSAESDNISEFDEMKIDVYPNPAANNVNIKFSVLPEQGTRIILTDLTGKELINKVVESTLENLNVRSFTAGIYIVRVENNSNYKISKLIID
ncbi:right-handed parallel beta-helix repeat-containing protein [uncultured Draconibacterium sp.]|uniref:right-handed parallel beta-helix repeat-containing protein n=1 Tax=uncultured Draconibacterium sp. TaxID=1573823 RepID=UPI0029C7AD9A|nr:right-handed parallel beta-helix repeat-containing protein [uncultured Draconibacterium sp.]